mmetsp:Transcript_113206/g.305519  ORF Transcript_113206/g.305519 Transcript_113206/m.305519 type:complete len:321 (-) Transcript_113206:2-964(-)
MRLHFLMWHRCPMTALQADVQRRLQQGSMEFSGMPPGLCDRQVEACCCQSKLKWVECSPIGRGEVKAWSRRRSVLERAGDCTRWFTVPSASGMTTRPGPVASTSASSSTASAFCSAASSSRAPRRPCWSSLKACTARPRPGGSCAAHEMGARSARSRFSSLEDGCCVCCETRCDAPSHSRARLSANGLSTVMLPRSQRSDVSVSAWWCSCPRPVTLVLGPSAWSGGLTKAGASWSWSMSVVWLAPHLLVCRAPRWVLDLASFWDEGSAMCRPNVRSDSSRGFSEFRVHECCHAHTVGCFLQSGLPTLVSVGRAFACNCTL